MRKGRGCPSPRDTGRRRVELHKTVLSDQRRRKEQGGSPCTVKVQKGLLCAAAFTFFSVISLSLPPNLSLPHSAEGSASSKDTLVDSRKSGCCRSDKNLVGVSMWVEPVEEQRRLHHSSLSTCHAPFPTLSPKPKGLKTSNLSHSTHTHRHTRTHTHTQHARHVAQTHRTWTHRHRKKTWRGCNSKTTVVFKDNS